MATMILRMTTSVIIYLIITAAVWKYRSRHELTWGSRIGIGLIFGAAAIAATHLGISEEDMILNVRDIGPLAAGLFFDPYAGIIAGVLAGAERFYTGMFLGVASFSTVACSLTTILAGIFGALMRVFFYKGKRSPAGQSFFIGAVMEDFHMYAVLLTHRDSMNRAYNVVRNCAIPMILFGGLGIMACSIVIYLVSGEKKERVSVFDRERTPISIRFSRRLLAVTFAIFVINHVMDYNFQERNALQDAEAYLQYMGGEFKSFYDNTGGDMDKAVEYLPYISMGSSDTIMYFIFNEEGDEVGEMYDDEDGPLDIDGKNLQKIKDNLGEGVFIWEPPFKDEDEMVCVSFVLDKPKNLYMVLALSYEAMIQSQGNKIYEIFLSDVLLFSALFLLIVVLMETLVCRNLKSVNNSLQKIIRGNLDEVVTVRESVELSLLSDDINQTVTTLKGYINEAERRMEEELKLATFIQESALPHVFTFSRKDFEIYALMKPARYVGGDFYDFFFTESNKLALVIADVSGKGIPAALFMMRAKTAILNAARTGKSAAETLYEVNNSLCEGNEAEMFVTAWVGIIDLKTGLMNCANAGHEYPVFCHAGGEYELVRDDHGLVLGAMENAPMKEYALQMQPGDRLFVYTDGVPEAIDKDEKAYGTGRLVDKLNELREEPQKETLEKVHHDIVKFVKEAEQFDDITMLGFTYIGGKPVAG
ncbi:MAG: SpoIIE family protein phosphatase [Lachnospiraceae bacterium]|nr:SpoIIE family protein phosphatase [Lachnospiraceae bacterium]